MTKTIKTLVISDAMMNEISGGRRLPVSKFAGIVERCTIFGGSFNDSPVFKIKTSVGFGNQRN